MHEHTFRRLKDQAVHSHVDLCTHVTCVQRTSIFSSVLALPDFNIFSFAAKRGTAFAVPAVPLPPDLHFFMMIQGFTALGNTGIQSGFLHFYSPGALPSPVAKRSDMTLLAVV